MTPNDDDPTALDFRSLTFPGGDDAPWNPGKPGILDCGGLVDTRNLTATLLEDPDLIGIDEAEIASQVWGPQRTSDRRSKSIWLIRAVMEEATKARGGKGTSRAAVITGVRLAVARTHGEVIRTHEREIALALGVRYVSLIRARKIATRLIEEHGIRFW